MHGEGTVNHRKVAGGRKNKLCRKFGDTVRLMHVSLLIKVTQYHAVFGKDKLHQNSLIVLRVSELSLKLNAR